MLPPGRELVEVLPSEMVNSVGTSDYLAGSVRRAVHVIGPGWQLIPMLLHLGAVSPASNRQLMQESVHAMQLLS